MDIEQLCEDGIKAWQACGTCDSLFAHSVTQKDKEKNEESIRAMMTKVDVFTKAFPKGKRAKNTWKKRGIIFLQEFLENDAIFLMKEMNKEDSDVFLRISSQFMKDARAFDETLALEDIGQALRNIWIVIILQRIFGEEVRYHEAMFAYSMLYPYSDNYIDNPTIPLKRKQQFNQWFTNRLNDMSVVIHNVHEQHISDLIKMIENKFSRLDYPQVYESLLAIQTAQVISLEQQDGSTILSKEELTYISYRKGGTSVLADGCLIHGSLQEKQIQFCMEYGFMLQICDDLQDGKYDELHAHQTLISTTLADNLDAIVYKLIQYTKDIFMPRDICKDKTLLDFVYGDCLMLIFLAVIQNKEYYTPQTFQEILSCMPTTQSFILEMLTSMKWDMKEDVLLEQIDCLLEDIDFDKG